MGENVNGEKRTMNLQGFLPQSIHEKILSGSLTILHWMCFQPSCCTKKLALHRRHEKDPKYLSPLNKLK